MKKSIILFAAILFFTACEDFLTTTPKGTYYEGNYDLSSSQELMIISKLFDGYDEYRNQTWPLTALQCLTNDNTHMGGPAGDGGTDFNQFPTLTFTPSNDHINNYYNSHYIIITKANEALKMIDDYEKEHGESAASYQYRAEAFFLRGSAYFRLTQAFGAVPYVDHVMGKEDEVPDQLSASTIRSIYLNDLIWGVPYLPTREQMVQTGNLGRATQNAARAIIAKTYMYEGDWGACRNWTKQIMDSGDNSLFSPYGEIWWETNEYCSESVWELNCDFKPSINVDMRCQWCMMNGVRGMPNLGWGHNAPSADLMADFEQGDPRYEATVLEHGQMIDGDQVDASHYKFFNRKCYCPKSERTQYNRDDWCYGYWANMRIIRYSDIILMYAEACLETGDMDEAKRAIEMVRSRARNGKSPITCLPAPTTKDINELRTFLHHERRIELALEFERYFDLVRWGEAAEKLPGFQVGKHERFPLPQQEIDKANGKLVQNPGY